MPDSLRERLVDTGVELLERDGVGGLGLRAIARAAGVSHGAPRRWFPTHAALLAAIAARGFGDLIGRFAQSATGDDPRARLRTMAQVYVDFAVTRPEMFTLMFRHDLLAGSGENLRGTTGPLYRRIVELVDAAGAGEDAPRRALALWTNIHGLATVAANRTLEVVAPEEDPRELAERIVGEHLAFG
ncbi:TetR/AcrR family transcriptional regulator [Nocardia sp. AG03]|uniref:TetR/AcrR family transcriptional regulator n=1 Tax=Nocardia sp. AG03 TaxID=3025312 RepID=UPI002418728C|nr:TetR/AcrR family transcriptional regulator [Nocardia sp. AG03]